MKTPTASCIILAAFCVFTRGAEGGMTVVAMAAGQTAEVHVVNDHRGPKLPCHLSVYFADREGNLISDENLTSLAVSPGEIRSVSMTHPTLLPGERYHMRVIVRAFESKSSQWNECGAVRAAVDLYDVATGKTAMQLDVPVD